MSHLTKESAFIFYYLFTPFAIESTREIYMGQMQKTNDLAYNDTATNNVISIVRLRQHQKTRTSCLR